MIKITTTVDAEKLKREILKRAEEARVPIECPNCKRKHQVSIADAKKERRIRCGCGYTIHLKFDGYK